MMAIPAHVQDIPKAFALPQKPISQPDQRRGWPYVFMRFMDLRPYSTIDVSGTVVTPVIQKERSLGLSVAEQVHRIEARLGMNRSQLAKVLMVTRKTIYDWCNKGAQPSSSNLERLEKLLEVANTQQNEAMGKYIGVNLQRPVLDGVSLLDILSSQSIDIGKAKDALQFVARLAERSKARMEAFARKRPKPLPKHEAQATLDEIAPRT